jgi:hypothetical protein
MADVYLCPLCGQENRCGNLVLKAPCWCLKESFPQGLLDSVPVDLVRKAYICKECLEKYKSLNEAIAGE